MKRGTCLLSYLPMRSKPRSGAEMVNTLIYGESYEVLESNGAWFKIRCDFDAYEGFISAGSYSPFVQNEQMVDALFVEAVHNGARFYIPCGALIPANGKFMVDGEEYNIIQKVKTNRHLPLRLRIINASKAFLNTPYLWGGRTFMGIDCSGLVQVVFKINGFELPRDTSRQKDVGTEVPFAERDACDLVFFSKVGEDKVTHVGILIDKQNVIHAGARVRVNELNENGLVVDGELAYQIQAIKRLI